MALASVSPTLDQTRDVLRLKHYSLRTERSYCDWIGAQAKVDLPAPLGPTNPIRSPRLTWSDTSSNSARAAKDFESCETVSIAESAQCSLVRCPAQLPSRSRTNVN